MSLGHLDFYSEFLQMAMSMDVLVPQKSISVKNDDAFQVLYLLHGMSDDHTIWQRRTRIEAYVEAARCNLLVVMPNAHRSFYSKMHQGENYWRYISEEIPLIISRTFKVSGKREDTFAAGLSMGGYGALKLGLACPEKFSAVASLSGAVMPDAFGKTFTGKNQTAEREFFRIFGDLDKFVGTENDLFHISSKLKESNAETPAIFQCCGTEDFLYQDNLKFRDHLKKLGFDFVYEEGPGTHSWDYWDANIQKVLKWLPLKKF